MVEHINVVSQAFSKQSTHYDDADLVNIILQEWRGQVYSHVNRFLKKGQRILEINAGTGIDALYFATTGHIVHATDLSDGMILQIQNKIKLNDLDGRLSCQQLSYHDLDKLGNQKFDYVLSNFGGLNCIDDLSKVTRHLSSILNKGAFVTWVIMPKVSLWELLGVLKGHGQKSFRRFKKNGTIAHVEGEYFPTYYHSLTDIQKAFGNSFRFVASEGLGALSPPPHSNLPKKNIKLYSILKKLNAITRNHFPFNRWGDHIIATFQFIG